MQDHDNLGAGPRSSEAHGLSRFESGYQRVLEGDKIQGETRVMHFQPGSEMHP